MSNITDANRSLPIEPTAPRKRVDMPLPESYIERIGSPYGPRPIRMQRTHEGRVTTSKSALYPPREQLPIKGFQSDRRSRQGGRGDPIL
jgi:hypothetical protein